MTDNATDADDPARDEALRTDGGDSPAAHSSSSFKIVGEDALSDGAAVLGHNTAASGAATGVHGVTDSTTETAAGVRGEGNGASRAVAGYNLDDPSLEWGFDVPAGVLGQTDAPGGNGVIGITSSDTGTGYGVFGRSSSPDSAAVFGYNDGGGPAVEANGHVEIADNGLSVWLDANLDVPDDDWTSIEFDNENEDDFGAFNIINGDITIPVAGTYHVSASVAWQNRLSGGTPHGIRISIDNSTEAELIREVPGSSANSPIVQDRIDKTLFGLSENQNITVDVYQNSGGTRTVFGAENRTYLTIHRVG